MGVMVDGEVDDEPSREEEDDEQEHQDFIQEGSRGKVMQRLCLLT